MIKRFAAVVALVGAFMASPAMAAGPLAEPTGEVLLTITGEIANTNAGEDVAEFDLAMLEALPATEYTTETIWTEGEHVFRGVTLGELINAVGAEGSSISAIAINDYAIDIPMSDATDGSALVAYRLDGETMSIREKGPLWIVYPYSSDPKYRAEIIYARSIWQLKELEISR